MAMTSVLMKIERK